MLLSAKDPKRKTLAKELEEEENTLKQCVEKLKLAEASRLALVSQLKEALHEQVLDYSILFIYLFYFSSMCNYRNEFEVLCIYSYYSSCAGIRTGECSKANAGKISKQM